MGEVITCTSTRCRQGTMSSSWSSNWTRDPVQVGGATAYVGEWEMSAPELDGKSISKITLNVYKSDTTSRTSTQYVTCSAVAGEKDTLVSSGEMITLSTDSGWMAVDVSGLAKSIESYTTTWYLVIGNPSTSSTEAVIRGYDSGYMLYLEMELSDGSKIYLASGNTLIPYKLYRAENGVLVPYDIYRGENGTLVKY